MTTTIHYSVSEGTETSNIDRFSSFATEALMPSLTPWTDSVDKNVIYTKCPVWNHRNRRNYIVRAPIDFSFSFNRDAPPERKLEILKLNRDVGDFILLQDGWDYSNPVFQFRFPTILFWTNNRNVWVESKPHAPAAARNNLMAVGGWWNVTKWNRPVNLAIQMIDETKPVTVKRGDPLFEVSFYNQHNLNDEIKLVRETEIPDKVWNEQHRNSNVKRYLKMMNPSVLFTDQPKSKCPFAFLKR